MRDGPFSLENFKLDINKCLDKHQRQLEELRANFIKLMSEAAVTATHILDDLRECFSLEPQYMAEILTSMEEVRFDILFNNMYFS